MNQENKAINIAEEWQRAETVLREAKLLASQALLEGAMSRAYYAAFHATQAVLLTQALQAKSHRGAIYLFTHHFIKTGQIEPEFSQMLARAAKYREEADYRHTMVFTQSHTDHTIQEVDTFLARLKNFLQRAGY